MRMRSPLLAAQRSTLLGRLAHEIVGIQLALERQLAMIGDPDITWRTEVAETGFFRALVGKHRDTLVVSHRRFREYAVVVLFEPHGTALHVVWAVQITPKLRNDLLRFLRLDIESGARFDIGAELDAFDVMDFRAFLSATRMALNFAIREFTHRDEEAIGGPVFHLEAAE